MTFTKPSNRGSAAAERNVKDDQMRSLLNLLFELNHLAAKLAGKNVQGLGLGEGVHLMTVGTAN